MGPIVRRALATHRGAWVPIAIAAVIALVPAAVLQGILEQEAVSQDSHPALFTVIAIEAAAVGALGYYFLSGVIAQIAVAARHGHDHPGLAEIARSLPWRNLIVVDLIVSVGTGIGIQLLVLPGLVFATWFGLAAVLVETRELDPRPALERSRELARGRFWLVLALLAIPLALVTGLAYPLEKATAVILPGSDEVAWVVGAFVAGAIVKPFSAVVTVELAIELDAITP